MNQEKQQKKNKKNNESAEAATTVVVEAAAAEAQEVERGERGDLGQATPSLKIRQMWHESHFKRVEVGDRHNPRKTVWEPNHNALSLKQFARQLAVGGDKLAKEWFANKKGAKNDKRSEKNQSRIALERQASKNARRKNSQKSAGKIATDALATATAVVAAASKGKK